MRFDADAFLHLSVIPFCRDAVDIFDVVNKLVAFHVLLSPNHRALQVGGLTTPTTLDGQNGNSSAVVITVRITSSFPCCLLLLILALRDGYARNDN